MVRARNQIVCTVVFFGLLGLWGCNKNSKQAAQNSTQQTTTTQVSNDQSAANTSANNANSGSPTLPPASASNVSPEYAPPPFSGANTQQRAPQQSAQQQQPEPLTIAAGSSVTVRLQQSLSSASAVPGERFEATIDEPVTTQNQIVIPVGATVYGHVVSARRSGRLRHPGEISLTLDSVVVDQQTIPLATSHVVASGGSHKKRNLAWIGGGSGGGALIGALAAGGKGALIGGGIGAAAGTTAALVTGKKDVTFAAERRLRFRLRQDVTVAG
jgi:hypothetical protein